MLSGRLLAQLSRVASADAHDVLDPTSTPNLTDVPVRERTLTPGDWAEHARLSQIAARCQVRSCLAGWYPGDDPWASDEDNEAMRCLIWDEVLP